MRIRGILLSAAIAIAALWGVQFVLAQGGEGEPHHITRWTLGSSSGGVITSSSFIVAGTTGQPVVGIAVEPDHHSSGGIWPPLYLPPPLAPPPIGTPIVIPTIVIVTPSPPQTVPIVQEPEVPPVDVFESMDAGGGYFPETLNLPSCPNLTPPDFPDTLNLPDMPTLMMTGYITETFRPVVSLTLAIMEWDTVVDSSLILGDDLAEDVMGIDMSEFRDGTGSPEVDLSAFTIAGYTAGEMATELVLGFDIVMLYLRSVNDIGIIGPTVAAVIVAFAWVMFLIGLRFVFRFIILPIWLVRRIWELLPLT